MFKRNEGVIDRIVRVSLGTVLLLIGIFFLVWLKANVLGLVVSGFGTWVLITGLLGFCPLYIPLGINTLEKEKKLIARCKSMMAGFRQGSPSSGYLDAKQPCGPCQPSIGETHHQQS